MSSLNDLIEGNAEAFDSLREELNVDDTTAYLLVRDGQTTGWESLLQLTRHWKDYYSNFRGQMGLRIATLDTAIIDAITRCSHMSIDGYVYEIDIRDKKPPDSDRPWWELFGDKTDKIFVPGP